MVTSPSSTSEQENGSKVEPIDFRRIEKVYAELMEMEIELDDDPLAYGPKRLNQKIAQTRLLLSRCERIFTQLAQELYQQQRRHRNAKLKFEIQKDSLFVNDPEVRAGRNIADREATAKTKLRALADQIFMLESNSTDLDTTLKIVRAKRTDLKDIQGRLRDQFKVCLEEITLGARWGSKLPGDKQAEWEPGQGHATAADANEIDELIEGMDKAETHLPVSKDKDYPPIGGEEVEPEEPESEKLTSTNVPEKDIDDILTEIDTEEGEGEVEASVEVVEADLDTLLDNFEG